MSNRSDGAPPDYPAGSIVIREIHRLPAASDGEGDGGNRGMWRRVLEFLICTCIAGLVGGFLLLRESVVVLQSVQQFQRETLLEFKDELKDVRSDIKDLQGRKFRGVDGYPDERDDFKP